MSRYAAQDYPALVDALEKISTLNEYDLEQEERVDAMLTERQEILDAMSKLDGSALCAEVRANLASRIRAVLATNDAHLSYIGRIREQIREDLDGMVTSRAAVRGYSSAASEHSSKRLSSL
jgi:hypothetical protein